MRRTFSFHIKDKSRFKRSIRKQVKARKKQRNILCQFNEISAISFALTMKIFSQWLIRAFCFCLTLKRLCGRSVKGKHINLTLFDRGVVWKEMKGFAPKNVNCIVSNSFTLSIHAAAVKVNPRTRKRFMMIKLTGDF